MVTLSDQKKSMLYDQLKIITILIVILGHCFIMFSPDGAITVLRKSVVLSYAASVIYRFHIPCFFMVSGAVFSFNLKKGKYGVFREFAKKKAVRLLVPYGIFGVFIVLPVLVFCGLIDSSRWYSFFWNLINGRDVRHLWYLYDLFFIFLIFWALRHYITEGNPKKVIAVSFLVSFIFRSLPFDFISYFQIGNIFYHQFFFLWGIFLDRYFSRLVSYFKEHRYLLYFSGLLLFMSCFFDLYTLSGYVYAASGVILTVSLAWFLCGREKWPGSKWENLIARDSYGIYLFHPMIIYLIFYGFSQRAVPVLLLLVLSLLVSFFVSLVLTELCRRAHMGFIIGEGWKKRALSDSSPLPEKK
ncbi:MAG: acyltransferase family protein [Clostridia bacterium]